MNRFLTIIIINIILIDEFKEGFCLLIILFISCAKCSAKF